ncbi:hypothetical protein [Micrococcus endophyticus]|uniref:hypothetical protein n=1 Tax=Micrococcus endophyticus TaxID=455343 RepID=UPI0034CF6F3D
MTRRAWRLRIVLASTAFGALFVLLTVGLSVVPAWVIGALPDPALQSPAAAVLASAVHGVLSLTTTPTPQPVPDVVRPGPSTG